LIKNIIKLYLLKKYLIINKSNFCFNIIFLVEVLSLLRIDSEYILNKFDAYDELAIDLRIWIFEIFGTSNLYLNIVCIFLCKEKL